MTSHKDRGGGQVISNGTRTPKPPLFSEDEKVLCYEPDQKKAQVLYDSKVLEVVTKKDGHGKSHFEYKIHFQGWKSSWDRHVREDNVLKDTEENRNLQRELNEQAQLLNKTNLTGKKKKRKTILEKIKEASINAKDSSAANGAHSSLGDGTHQSSGTEKNTTDQESSDDEDGSLSYQIYIPEGLKKILEDDYHAVKGKKKLVRLPSRWTVAELLEKYVSYVGLKELTSYLERRDKLSSVVPSAATGATLAPSALGIKMSVLSTSKTPSSARSVSDIANEELIKTFQRINFTKKIVEDVRIMFDFMVSQILLYEHERDQYGEFLQGRYYRRPIREQPIDTPISPPPVVLKTPEVQKTEVEGPPRKRRKTVTVQQQSTTAEVLKSPTPSTNKSSVPPIQLVTKNVNYRCELENKCEYPWACEQLNNFMDELMIYRLVPRELEPSNAYPSLCYGIIHLLRLFVKMPEILSKTSIPRKKLKTIVGQINKLVEYLTSLQDVVSDKDWYQPGTERKLYEEDFFGETTSHNLPRKRASAVVSTPQEISSSSRDSAPNKASNVNSAAPSSVPLPKRIKTEIPNTRRKTIVADVSATSLPAVVKVEEETQFERPIKRNQRRVTTGRMVNPLMIDGNALGVRKSLSIEELSRETLVAPSNPDLKQYSLRVHCRIPYK